LPRSEPDTGGKASVLVIGDVMNDIIIRPEGTLVPGADRRATIRPLPGGSGANQAAWLAARGLRVSFAGRAGAGDCDRHRDLLVEAGVEAALACDDQFPTGTIVTLLAPDGERSFFTDRGANDRLSGADLPEALLGAADHLHVSGYSLVSPGPRAAVLALAEAARARGVGVSIDPASHSFLEEIGPERFLGWTRGSSICFPNEAEAAVLTGTAAVDEQLDALTKDYALVVIKRGAAGAVAGAADGKRWSAAAPAVGALDTSGAGDAFVAAFIARWLSGGPLDACLAEAVRAGSTAVTRFGGRPPTKLSGQSAG
jgi:sugar/nucleoside kinase (ribokinase family)